MSRAASCVCLELRPLPSPGVTRLQRYYEPLRHPTAPGLSLAGVRLITLDHAMGFPVLRTLSLCTCCRHYPGAATGCRLRSSHPAVTAFPENVVGSACTSSFSRLARRSLALRPAHSRSHLYVTSYTEGFSHFVASMTAPVASGWSVCRVGLAPTGTRRIVTAHTLSGHKRPWPWTPQLGGKRTYKSRLEKDRSRAIAVVPSRARSRVHGPKPKFPTDCRAAAAEANRTSISPRSLVPGSTAPLQFAGTTEARSRVDGPRLSGSPPR